jgi:hypothetical protein
MQQCAPAQNNVINMIWILLSVYDWPIIMIDPSGLLLIISHLFAIRVSVFWVGLQKIKSLNLDVKNIFARLHVKHC